jgi:inosine-uridine nucleoside N-ribohydrolase
MLSPNLLCRKPNSIPIIHVAILVALITLAGCSTTSSTPTASPTSVVLPTSTNIPTNLTAIVLPSATPTSSSIVPSFPLTGDWVGDVHNGTLMMHLTIKLGAICNPGNVCGNFDLPQIPCSGTYVLAGENNGTYEFNIINKSAGCGTGKDYLQLLPDGTLQYISRGDYGESKGTLTQAGKIQVPTTGLPVIYDDDGSPDGTSALFYLLSDPAASVKAVLISHGETHAAPYIQDIARVLDNLGLSSIPLGQGSETSLGPGENFPDSVRQAADSFWGQPVPNQNKTYPVTDAASLIVSMLNQSSEPMAVFVSGPLTDLALALRQDPGIRGHISAVYIMGGAVYVPGNMSDFYPNPANKSAEWNIYVDPVAASEVFGSGLTLNLIPLDATNQVSVTMADIAQWKKGGKLTEIPVNLYKMLLNGSSTAKMGLWDVMTAEIMVHPELCKMTPLHLQVVTQEGNTYGQTAVLAGGSPNVQVCLAPNVDKIKQTLADVFAASH